MPPFAFSTRFRHVLRNGASIALALLACACTLGPDFKPPIVDAPAHYVAPAARHTPGVAIAYGRNPPPEWWEQFRSPQLGAVIHLALTDNRSLAATVYDLARAQEAVAASAGQRLPEVTASAGAARQQYGAAFLGPEKFPAFTAFSIGPTVSYLLDYDGGVKRAIELQQALADAQAYQVKAARLALTGNVALQSLTIAGSRAQIQAVRDLLHEDQRNVKLVQSALEAGSSTRVDLLSAQSQLAQDRTLLPPLRRQSAKARNALSILVGRAPANWNPPQFTLDDFRPPPALPLSLPSALAHRRPDILAAEARLHAATAAIGVATANLYPQIRLTASADQEALNPGHLFSPASTAWSLAAALTAPVFEGGTLHARRRAAIDAARSALATYQQTVLQSFGQVADVLQDLQQDAAALADQKQARDTAQASLLLTRESYRAGNTGILQVLDAQRQYQRARLGYLQAHIQRIEDTVQLYLALGGSTPTSNPPSAREAGVAKPATPVAAGKTDAPIPGSLPKPVVSEK